jgi:hypothetical protein
MSNGKATLPRKLPLPTRIFGSDFNSCAVAAARQHVSRRPGGSS